jgi:mono/diheme cytochrome c family protein
MSRGSPFVRSAAVAVALLLPLPASAADTDVLAQGRQLYLRYCSACHGEGANGEGVVSGLMRPKPIDLTQLAKRAGGTFPSAAVTASIDGRDTIRAHGDPNMPVWGEILSREEGPALDKETRARTMLVQITAYLESIQAK